MPGLHEFWIVLVVALLGMTLTGLTLVLCRRFGNVADRRDGIQRVHRHWAPRMGGLPIYATLAIGTLLWTDLPERHLKLLLLVCALPAFLAGLAEDLWNRVGPRARLFATFTSAWLAWFLMGGQLERVDLPGVDWLLQNVLPFTFLFTAFAVGGVAHSINIIDGFNGLSAGYCLICFAAFFIVGGVVDDGLIQGSSLLFAGSLLGFLAWNYPFGRVFLGDGGAYLVGFGLGELSVLLVARHPEVSAWFCLLLLIYPIWDTLFSSYRREIKRRRSWTSADALHLHHLVHRRLVRPHATRRERVIANALTAPYIWALGLICATLAVLYWHSAPILGTLAALFVVGYGLLYARLARFRAPRLLRMNRHKGPLVDVNAALPPDTSDDDTLAAK